MCICIYIYKYIVYIYVYLNYIIYKNYIYVYTVCIIILYIYIWLIFGLMIFYGLYNERYGCWCIWCFFNGLKWCQWIWYGLIWFKLVYNILWLYGQDVLMLMLMDLSWLIWLLCGKYGGRAEISFWNWRWIEVVGSRIQISLKKTLFKHVLNILQ
jgi:hypothetical protein